VLEAHRGETIGDEMGRSANVRCVLSERTDARDAQQLEVVGYALVVRTLGERIEVGEVAFADPRMCGWSPVVYAG
jgi:hypothetical protein